MMLPSDTSTVLMLEQAGNGLQGGTLPGPVRPQEGHNPPFRDFNGHALQDQNDLVVFDFNAVDF